MVATLEMGIVPHALALSERQGGWLDEVRALRSSAQHYKAAKERKAAKAQRAKPTRKENEDALFAKAIERALAAKRAQECASSVGGAP